MTWTKEVEAGVRRDIAAAETIAKEQGIPPKRVVLDYGVATKAVAEIERLTAKASVCEWQHRPCVDCGAMETFVGQGLHECWKCTATELKAERDTARAELHVCGLELQTCRATLEEERRDGDVQRAEIERLTAELAGQSKATLDWREAAKRHMARAEAAEKLALRMADEADLERELANLRHTVNEGIEITHDRAVKIDAQKAEIERLTVALRHAVDIARDIGAQRDRAFDAANRATDMRPGLTEEQALATAGPLSRDIYNRIGLATGNKIGAPEWMRDAIAAALLRASRGAPAPGDVVISRTILERVAKAAASDPDAREARWAAERILQQADLAAEPARTDPSQREVGEPGATFREVSAEACPLCAVVGGAK